VLTNGLQVQVSQEEFGRLVGISQQKVSQLVNDGVLERGATALEWLRVYCDRLREMAAGRGSEGGGLDLVQERAALAREQRIGQAIKNAVARTEYAPVSALAEVLATASQAVAERFDALPGKLRTVCPDLPDAARTAIETAMAEARNEWVRATESLTVSRLDDEHDEEDEPGDDAELEAFT
jgi:phage terminase Nu1 subunit (DNA packaging protein)